ncbi:hypothetical protein T439DRAFT_326461 [Meredithblackwellia eburnea MCA 4105]
MSQGLESGEGHKRPGISTMPSSLSIHRALSSTPEPPETPAETLQAPAPVQSHPNQSTTLSESSTDVNNTQNNANTQSGAASIPGTGGADSPAQEKQQQELVGSENQSKQLQPSLSRDDAATTATTTQLVGEGEVVTVEFLLVSGRRTKVEFGESATVDQVRVHLWKNWPAEWRGDENDPTSVDALRLLYLGRFLDDKETLKSVGIQPGPPTIIHLTIRTLQPLDDNPLKPARFSASGSGEGGGMCGCHCIVS